jgi:peptidoglycan/xylan/chitin deacetylase (PgdA/CDA1 family)
MADLRNAVFRAGLETLYFSGAYHALRPFCGGVGAILTLHHVRPERPGAFQPNRLLEVTPRFLENVIVRLKKRGIDLVSLDEMHRRMVERNFSRRFVAFTFDDGYRDNLEHAWPILRRHAVPLTMFVATSFPDRLGELWWVVIEQVIAKTSRLVIEMDGGPRFFDCADAVGKRETFAQVYWWLRSFKDERELRSAVRDLAQRYGVDVAAPCRELCMDWPEIARLAADPLVKIGAHTVNHVMLRRWAVETARAEMKLSADVIEAALGERPRHFAFPVGDPSSAGAREFQLAAELGFKTAVTTRPGVLFPEHREHLMALPRVSLNGHFQALRFVDVLLSGAPFALANRFRRLNAA